MVIGKPADGWGDDTLIEQLWLEHGDIRRVEAEEELRLLCRQARQEGNPTQSLEDGPISGTDPACIEAVSLLGHTATRARKRVGGGESAHVRVAMGGHRRRHRKRNSK